MTGAGAVGLNVRMEDDHPDLTKRRATTDPDTIRAWWARWPLAMIGLRWGWMMSSTVLVETVFDWPGIGLYAVSSAIAGDFKPVMGVTLISGLNFMVANLIVDLLYGALDPRLREAR